MAETMDVDDTQEKLAEEESDSSEDDSDKSEDDEQEETDLRNKAEALRAQLSQSPYMYDNHVELLKILKSLGDLEQLREARTHMSKLFPLTEELWLDWVKDEGSIATDKAARGQVNQLFEKAVQDYLSVPVWLEYVQFAIGGMGHEGIESVRQVFDQAITTCGLHVTKGAMLWEANREFESAILAGLLPDPGKIPTKDQEDKFSEQHDKVNNLFKRQLTVPLLDMEETLAEYKDWLQEDPDKFCRQTYNKALIKLEKIRPYEDNLSSAEPPRLQEYQDYIKFEEKEGEPARVQCLYERALQENCLNPTMWLQFTKYLDHTLRVSSLTIPVYERSVRNCPWCVQLWQNYILCLERANKPFDKVKEVFEAALTSGFSQGQEYLLLWTTFLDCLRRRIKWTEDHTEDLNTFKLTIEKAIDQVDEFGAEGDPNGTLRQLWAFIEGKYCKNLEKARELWAKVMAAGRANEAALWMENYRFERAYGDSKHCRRVLQRALNSVTDWPESIVDAYVNFEREEGNLEQYDQAVSKCESQMARINERREKSEAEGAAQGKKKFDKRQPRQADGKQRQQKGQFVKQKPGQPPEPREPAPQVKPYKRKAEDAKPADNGFKVPDLPPPAKVARSDPPPGFRGQGKSSPPPGFKGQGKTFPPPGYPKQEPSSGTEDSKPADTTGSGDDGSRAGQGDPGAQTQNSESWIPMAPGNEFRTVFISNLSYNVDEEKLKSFFSKCGPVDEVRLVKNFLGKSKGYAYVQFADQFAVVKALTYDRTSIDNRPMYVSKYEDRSNKKKADFRYATNLEKNKLFIKNLPFSCTKDALKTLFSQHGEVTDVRIVTFKSGQSKGLAYVVFADEHCAAQAIMKTDGLQMGEHEISVALSNPPPRKDPSWKREEPSFTPSLGGGKKETQNRGVARTQVVLMPRSVKQKSQAKPAPGGGTKAAPSATATAAGGEPESSAEAEGEAKTGDKSSAGMSNADFRNMLLKK